MRTGWAANSAGARSRRRCAICCVSCESRALGAAQRCAGGTILRFRSKPVRELYGGRARKTTTWMRGQGWSYPQPCPRYRRSHPAAGAIRAQRVGGVSGKRLHEHATSEAACGAGIFGADGQPKLVSLPPAVHEMSRHTMIVSLTHQTCWRRQQRTSVAGGRRSRSMLIDGYRRAACRVVGTGRRISRR